MAIISVGMPFYCRHILNQAGEKQLPLVRKKQIISHWVAPILSYLLVILPFFINMGRFGLIIPYCGVAGLYIVLKESSFAPHSGVYEKLLINSSTILRFEDIKELPESAESNVLFITTKTKHRFQLVFDNQNEAKEVLNAIQNALKSIDKHV